MGAVFGFCVIIYFIYLCVKETSTPTIPAGYGFGKGLRLIEGKNNL